MDKIQKKWFKFGYNDAQSGEHPDALCQEAWMKNLSHPMETLITYFPFYKQGVIKAYNEKQQ
jgi:hypothetical protein